MPKVVLSREIEKEKKRCNFIAAMLTGGIRQRDLTPKEVSKKTGIAERTVYERLNHPENMRVFELYKIADLAGVEIRLEFKDIPD